MTAVDLFTPEDDAFIRTAIRGLRPPEHHPTFWDTLRDQLDDVADVLAAEGLLPVPGLEEVAVDDLAGPEPVFEPEPEPEWEADVEEDLAPLLAEEPAEPAEPLPAPRPARHAVTSWGPAEPHPPRRAPLRATPDTSRTPPPRRRAGCGWCPGSPAAAPAGEGAARPAPMT